MYRQLVIVKGKRKMKGGRRLTSSTEGGSHQIVTGQDRSGVGRVGLKEERGRVSVYAKGKIKWQREELTSVK
jgi:hypothetical protein